MPIQAMTGMSGLAACGSVAAATYDSIILAESSLVHYYPLNETSGSVIHDSVSSGGVNSSTQSGLTLNQTSRMPTCTDPCILFGSSGAITIPAILLASGSDWSVEWWGFLPTAAFNTNFGCPLWIGGSSTAGWGPQCDSTTLDINQTLDSRVVGPTAGAAKNGNAHVVITKSGTTMIFYINGTGTTKTVGTMDAPGSGSTYIGNLNGGGGGSNYVGPGAYLQKVAFYNAALSSTRVSAHYAAG